MMEKPFAITLDVGSQPANHTGSWRTERPVYVRRLPPCNGACPAGENIQGWLYHAEAGDYEAAWRRLVADNPLPAVMGRVCLPPLRDRLQPGPAGRGGRDQLRRALPRRPGHRATAGRCPTPPPDTGKQVLVVGAGPGGLSAAYHLRRLGHAVDLRDAAPTPVG